MNINLSPSNESSKVSSSVAGEVVSENSETSEVSESGGFFAKLAALIKGEPSSEEVSTEESSGEEAKVKGGRESTEALLKSSGDSEDVETVQKPSGEDPSEDVKNTEKTMTKGELNENDQSGDPKQVVSDNEELLGRLNDASKALQPKEGNNLPQEESASDNQDTSTIAANKVMASEEHHTKASAEGVSGDEQGELKSIEVDGKPLTQQNLQAKEGGEKEAAIPESAQRFIQQDPISLEGKDSKVQTSDSEDNTGKALAASVASGAAGASLVAAQAKSPKGEAPELESAPLDKALAEHQGQVEQPLSKSASIEKIENVDGQQRPQSVESAQLAAVTQSPINGDSLNTSDKHVDLPQESIIASSQMVAETGTGSSAAVAATGAVTTGAVAAAIPWSSGEAEAKPEVALMEGKPKSQQANLAQSVQQAVAANQQPTPALQSAMLADKAPVNPMTMAATSEFSAAQAMPAFNPASTAASEKALLQAAMGAKVGAGLGKLASGEGKSNASNNAMDASFAQQLSQLSGQSGQLGQVPNQVRAEQAIAQTPLQMTRSDMAGDQLAERVQMMMSKNLKNIDIRLDPPELGRMQIRMNLGGEGATVHFTVANQQARDVIEQSMPRLREMLSQQGVQLGDTSVQQQAQGQGQSRYAHGEQGQNGQGIGNQAMGNEENLEADVKVDLNVATKRDGISYYA